MAIRTRQVKNKRDSNGVLTGRPGTVYDVDIKYTAPDGAKKTYTKRGFATKRDASQHEAEMRTKLQNPGQIASIASQRKQTVANYLNEWVESYARVNLRPSTYDGYKKTIANYINPYIGGVALNQLTPAMVDKMVSADYRQRLETVHRSRGKARVERGVEPCPEIPLYRNQRGKGHADKVWKKRQDTRPLHAGTGESPHAARGGNSLGNARHSGRALRYAPFRNSGLALAQC